jgi:hypothetical protein
MMDSKLILAQIRKRRERTVDLGGGKTVTFMRPTEVEMARMLARDTSDPTKMTWKVEIEDVRRCVTGWAGVTQADLLGADFAPPDAVPFDAELWAEVCSDSIDFVNKVADEILDSVVDHILKREEARKNSLPA